MSRQIYCLGLLRSSVEAATEEAVINQVAVPMVVNILPVQAGTYFPPDWQTLPPEALTKPITDPAPAERSDPVDVTPPPAVDDTPPPAPADTDRVVIFSSRRSAHFTYDDTPDPAA